MDKDRRHSLITCVLNTHQCKGKQIIYILFIPDAKLTSMRFIYLLLSLMTSNKPKAFCTQNGFLLFPASNKVSSFILFSPTKQNIRPLQSNKEIKPYWITRWLINRRIGYHTRLYCFCCWSNGFQ